MGDGIAVQVGVRIRAARRARDLSLRELGEDTDIDFGYLGKVERGASASLDTYERIAGALGLPLSALFGARQGSVARPTRRSRKSAA
jgi:transcriptional regulator with XRE-family HTH domain